MKGLTKRSLIAIYCISAMTVFLYSKWIRGANPLGVCNGALAGTHYV
jgi:hypothetical protein